MSTQPASQVPQIAAVLDRQQSPRYVQEGRKAATWLAAYDKTVSVTTLERAKAEVTRLARRQAYGRSIPLGAAARRLADSYAELGQNGPDTHPWWNDACTASMRLLWRAANGLAVEHGC